jgi:hypothetical protein
MHTTQVIVNILLIDCKYLLYKSQFNTQFDNCDLVDSMLTTVDQLRDMHLTNAIIMFIDIFEFQYCECFIRALKVENVEVAFLIKLVIVDYIV